MRLSPGVRISSCITGQDQAVRLTHSFEEEQGTDQGGGDPRPQIAQPEEPRSCKDCGQRPSQIYSEVGKGGDEGGELQLEVEEKGHLGQEEQLEEYAQHGDSQ